MTRDQLCVKLHETLSFADHIIPIMTNHEPRATAAPSFKLEKFVSETALLLYATHRAGDGELRSHSTEVAGHLEPYARSKSMVSLMHMRPSHTSELAVAHICLTQLGHHDTSFDHELELITSAVAANSSERTPWKELEASWAEEKSGFQFGASVDGTAARTLFARGPDSVAARREDLYAFTHALIYLTDFGNKKVTLPRPVAALIGDADAALARCLDEDDFDLGAEVLLTWPYLDMRLTDAAQFTLLVLTRVRSEIGILPSMTLRGSTDDGCEGDRIRQLVTEAYHTEYTFGLLSAGLLGARQQLTPEPRSTYGNAYRELVKILAGDEHTPQWLTDFANLSNEQKSTLAPLLASIAIRRLTRSGDLAGLHRVIETALEHRLPVTPPLRQAADLLRRLSRSRFLV